MISIWWDQERSEVRLRQRYLNWLALTSSWWPLRRRMLDGRIWWCFYANGRAEPAVRVSWDRFGQRWMCLSGIGRFDWSVARRGPRDGLVTNRLCACTGKPSLGSASFLVCMATASRVTRTYDSCCMHAACTCKPFLCVSRARTNACQGPPLIN